MELLKSDLTELSFTDESPSTCALNLLLAANFMLENLEIIKPFDNSTANYWYQVSWKSGSDPFTKSSNATWCTSGIKDILHEQKYGTASQLTTITWSCWIDPLPLVYLLLINLKIIFNPFIVVPPFFELQIIIRLCFFQ